MKMSTDGSLLNEIKAEAKVVECFNGYEMHVTEDLAAEATRRAITKERECLRIHWNASMKRGVIQGDTAPRPDLEAEVEDLDFHAGEAATEAYFFRTAADALRERKPHGEGMMLQQSRCQPAPFLPKGTLIDFDWRSPDLPLWISELHGLLDVVVVEAPDDAGLLTVSISTLEDDYFEELPVRVFKTEVFKGSPFGMWDSPWYPWDWGQAA